MADNTSSNIVATYDYRDGSGKLRYQVVRREPKSFYQRRPDGGGGWINNLDAVERVLYRLPELMAADPAEIVWIPEGEADVQNLVRLGLVATTNAGGAGKWRREYSEYLRGRYVALLPDNDKPGKDHAEMVAKSLAGVARTVKVVVLPDLPDKGDVTDWLVAGGTANALRQLAASASEYSVNVDEDDLSSGDLNGPSNSLPPYHLTDLGNAKRLVALHGGDLRFCHAWKKWLVWDGTRFAVDECGEVERRAKDTVMTIYNEAAAGRNNDRRRAELVGWAKGSESSGRIHAMVDLARSELGIPVTPDNLDADPWLLNCANGTLDLRSGKLREHRRKDLCTKLVPVSFDPNATCPLFEAFLTRILSGNAGLVSYLQRSIGYTLTGSTSEQVIQMLHGTGANGKTTLLEIFRRLLGDYAKTADASLLLTKKDDGIRNDVARLAGARLVTTAETEAGRHFAEALVKQLTGGDKITARFLYGEHFEFDCQFKLFLATNHRPHIRGFDKGIWRRIRLIPFDVTIPDDEQDKELPEKLRGELPGILAWAVWGCLEWQHRGLGVPPEVSDATEAYRQDSDRVGAFIEEYCIQKKGGKTAAGKLYDAYEQWCRDSGEEPISKKDFGTQLTERGFRPDRTGKSRLRIGIELKTAMTHVTHDDVNSADSSDTATLAATLQKSASHVSHASPNDEQLHDSKIEVEI